MDLSTLGCQRNQKKDSRHITRGMFIPPGKSDLGCISTLKTVWIELPREREKSILNPLLDADSCEDRGRPAGTLRTAAPRAPTVRNPSDRQFAIAVSSRARPRASSASHRRVAGRSSAIRGRHRRAVRHDPLRDRLPSAISLYRARGVGGKCASDADRPQFIAGRRKSIVDGGRPRGP